MNTLVLSSKRLAMKTRGPTQYLRMGLLFSIFAVILACTAAEPSGTTGSNTADDPIETDSDDTNCHRVDPSLVVLGQNVIVDASGAIQAPQGRPIQDGWTLQSSSEAITDHNAREFARVAAYMMPIRDALMCDLASTTPDAWASLTAILTLNNIKTVQDLSGTPAQQVYSTDGIYEHLTQTGADFHPMMKYLEEAELELKCLAFVGFDFTNPEGENHCVIHNLVQGAGLVLP